MKSLFTTIILLMVLFFAFFAFKKDILHYVKPHNSRQASVSVAQKSPEERMDQMTETFRRFLDCERVQNMKAFVRNPMEVAPRMMEYYSHYPLLKGHMIPSKPMAEWEEQEVTFCSMFFTLRGNTEQVYHVIFEAIGDELKIDWESLVAHGETTLSELEKSRPQNPMLVRVMMSAPPDRQHLNLATPHDASVLAIPFPWDRTELVEQIEEVLHSPPLFKRQADRRATLTISFAPNSEKPTIHQILSPTWLVH